MSDEELLQEQRTFYEVEAPDYDAWFEALLDPANDDEAARTFRTGQARTAALLAELAPLGRVLEVAGGTGVFTDLIVPWADELTVVDGSAPSLALAARRVAHHGRPVTWVEADLFTWSPSAGEVFDTVLFSSWLHHVPDDRFDAFWSTLAGWLAPGGRVVFDFATSSPAPPLDVATPPSEDYTSYQPADGVARRDHRGRRWRVVHVLWDEAALLARLRGLGWAVEAVGDGWFGGARWAVATRGRP